MNKETEIAHIARLVNIPNPGIGVGSSVSKALFDGVCKYFSLDATGTMPDQAERIVTAAGFHYDAAQFDSRHTPSRGGSTVTLEGLRAIRAAVEKLRAREAGAPL